jgi:AraC-like DNA-binding protein
MAVGLRSVGSFTTSFRRAYAMAPTAYRVQFAPAALLTRVPTCVVRAYGRPEHRTFGEDGAIQR